MTQPITLAARDSNLMLLLYKYPRDKEATYWYNELTRNAKFVLNTMGNIWDKKI